MIKTICNKIVLQKRASITKCCKSSKRVLIVTLSLLEIRMMAMMPRLKNLLKIKMSILPNKMMTMRRASLRAPKSHSLLALLSPLVQSASPPHARK